MENAAHMVISFVSHKNEWFKLLKVVFVWRVCVCQNQKLQFSDFRMSRQLTQIRHNSTVMDIWMKTYDNLFNPDV